jgi:RNA polymerase sigma factor (sigma-70 family)
VIESKLIVGWFEAHAAALVLYARQWLSSGEAEDVVHDVFVRLIAMECSPDDAKAWLFRAVRNEAISKSRSFWRRKRREANVSRDRREWFEHRVDDLIDAAAAQRALANLSNEQREVVVLRIWAALAFQEIADLVGVSVSTAFERYKMALGLMKSQIQKSDHART